MSMPPPLESGGTHRPAEAGPPVAIAELENHTPFSAGEGTGGTSCAELENHTSFSAGEGTGGTI